MNYALFSKEQMQVVETAKMLKTENVLENQEREKKKRDFRKLVILSKQQKALDNLESKRSEDNIVW